MRWFESMRQDLVYGLRLLRRTPTLSAAAILTLAIGTGANAAIFQLVNAVRLRTLPVERPGELVAIAIDTRDRGRTGQFRSRRPMLTEPLWQEIRTRQEAFSSIFVWGITSWNLATDGSFQPARGLYVSGQFYSGLGVRPQLGRVLGDPDDTPGCSTAGAVLTHGFWQSRYGGNPAVIGQSISLDGHRFEIVGVTPPSFFGVEVGRTFDVALPLCAETIIRGAATTGIGKRDVWFLDTMARLKPGWTRERAEAHLAAISPSIFSATVPPSYTAEVAKHYAEFRLTATAAETGVSGLRNAYSTQLWVLLGATGLVLLVTCANLANLMLARATAREREIAVRLAIGASRRRLVKQMLMESLLIAAAGAALGALIAQWMSRTLVAFLSTRNNQLFVDLAADWRVFGFIAAVSAAACLIFGLSPALKATATNPGRAVQSGGRSVTDAPERFTLRRALVVVQVALSMVLIVGALLFARSLRNLSTLDTGFDHDGVLSAFVDLRRAAVPPDALLLTHARILERVRAVPGIRHAAQAFIVPLSGSGWNQNILIDGKEQEGNVNFNGVGGDYFQAMGTTLIAGRTFSSEDRIGTPETAIVNETFARKYFGGANPIGRAFQIVQAPGEPRPHYQIVGLVEDTKYTGLREEFTPIAYLAATQERDPGPALSLVLRSELPESVVTPVLTRTIGEAVPGATVNYGAIRTYARDAMVTERLMASLSGFFGVMAILIASIGLYGVMSYMVTRRTVEIGIRMALGAEPGTVVRMILRESAWLLAGGAVAGMLLAAALARLIASLFYGVQAWDPVSYAIGAAVLGTVMLAAAWTPAYRASRVAPTVALRPD